MRHEYRIKSEDIELAPLNEETSEKYRQLRCNPNIGKWFTFKGIISKEQQKDWYNKYLDNTSDVMFSIFDDKGSFIGCNSIYDIASDGTAEYGRLIVDPVFAGKGYGYKAWCGFRSEGNEWSREISYEMFLFIRKF